MEPRHRSRPRRRLGALVPPIWRLNTAILVAAGALLASVVGDLRPLEPAILPWWLLAGAIAMTERWPVNLEFRRSAHSFSLTDLPLTLSLMFLGGTEGFLAVALGGAVALYLRRLPAVKFVFNLGQFLLATCLGMLVVHALGRMDGGFGWATWIGAMLATQVGGLSTIALLCGAIRLTEGAITREQVRQMFGMDAVVTVTNTSLALIFAVITVEAPLAAPLLLVPIVVVFCGYRTFVRERQRHEQLEFLYEANRTLSESPEIAVALEGLLERASEAFRADQAEVILHGGDGATALRTSLGPGDARAVMEPVDADVASFLRTLAAAGPVALDPPFAGPLGAYFQERGIRHGVVAVLRGEERVIG